MKKNLFTPLFLEGEKLFITAHLALFLDRVIIKFMKSDEKKAKRLNLLLFQLGELVKDPPTALDIEDWKKNVEYVMQEIRDISDHVYDRLDDLVTEVVRIGEEHIHQIDMDEAPSVVARSGELYFTQIAYLNSEINMLKSL